MSMKSCADNPHKMIVLSLACVCVTVCCVTKGGNALLQNYHFADKTKFELAQVKRFG